MPDHDDVPFGLYERLITASLKARLLQFDPPAIRVSSTSLDPAEAHATLSRHVEGTVARALRSLPQGDQQDRIARQADVANEIIRLLGEGPPAHQGGTNPIEQPPEQLRSIQRITRAPALEAIS